MKHTVITIIMFFFAAFLFGQNPHDDPKTMDAFRAACARIGEHSIITGNFELEKTANRRSRMIQSSGNFIVSVGLGMVWDTERPHPSTLVLGKDYIIQSRPGGHKNVINAKGNEMFTRMAQVMDAVFSGNAQGLLDNFEVKFITGEGGNTAWELELVPKDKAISLFMEKIVVKGDAAIHIMEMYDQMGGMVKYILSGHKFQAELSENEKSFFVLP